MKTGLNLDVATTTWHDRVAYLPNAFCATPFCSEQSLTKRFCFTRGIVMPLLRPADPQVLKKNFYLRIEESLAVTLDRYAEFFGTN
jgi:hypothetical protein